MTPSYVKRIGDMMDDNVELKINAAFGNWEDARLHMSAFRTIIETSYHIINNPSKMLDAYPEYFKEIIDELVERGEDREHIKKEMAEALAKLFSINQRLAFMVGTELADVIGADPIDERLMNEPIERSEEGGNTPEEMLQEAINIVRNSSKLNDDERGN
jgi:hypothetical protein